ncbi:MAG TPA: pseudouridine synthase, partial [Acidobacteriota bacterium]|nr:pseudouridine synthase [Acidobacteriota bacterium]
MQDAQRLQKIIAASGLASRRKAEELIEQGRVTVNGSIITQPGTKADPERDFIRVDGKLIRAGSPKRYLLLYKPKQVISSVADPEGRLKVTDLIGGNKRIYPVGRLDYNTEGLILLTNDGEFARIVTSAGKHMPKVYHVKVKSAPDGLTLARLREGIQIKGGVKLDGCGIEPLKEGANSWYEVTLFQGKNRQIREMFDAVGHPVLKLRRVKIG